MIKPFGDLLIRFRKDERGVFLVFFAIIAIVLIAASGAVVDFTRVQQARTRAQIALDSAALALQSKINDSGVTATTLQADAQALLTERIADSSVTAVVESATPDTTAGKLTITGYISVPTYFVQLVGIKDIRSSMLSEVTRSSSDLEVSLAIDITGSMAKDDCKNAKWWEYCVPTDKIGDLIKASNMLIDLLVSTTQTPTYSKMAIVPWSNVVNPGSYLNTVRGAPNATTVNITAASWSTGSAKNISSITKGSTNTTINSTAHGFNSNDVITISDVSGLTASGSSCINSKAYVVTKINANSYSIPLNSNSCTNATANTGKATKCQVAKCEMVVTAKNHGYANGAGIHIAGASWLSSTGYIVANASVDTLSLVGSFGPTEGTYANGGKIWCGAYGCSYRVFLNGSTLRDYPVAPCVTERIVNYNTDASPGTTPLGYFYNSNGSCLGSKVVPLTADRDVLHAAIGNDTPVNKRKLIATGNTAGHLGLAWGWYMLAPNFASVWPTTAPAPKAYGSSHLIKAIIFMTDGEFNQQYCSGVTDGQACTNTNGSSKTQAQALCNAIKTPAYNTLLYVVGFDLAGNQTTLDFLRGCATNVSYFFQADDGSDLEAAFKNIAGSLSELRISR